MRDYLATTKGYLSKIKSFSPTFPYTNISPKVIATLAFAATVGLVTEGAVAMQTINGGMAHNYGSETDAGTKKVNISVATQSTKSQPAVLSSTTSSKSFANNASTSKPKTSVTVNNVPINIPANGTVHKEIRNGNSKTQVDVSVNSDHSGVNNIYTSSNLYMNTNTITQDMDVNSP